MSAGRATRDDVAKRAGVSSAVVSYVLNKGPRPVAELTRHKVEEAIAALDYRPNTSARALTLARTNVLGLLIPDISNPFFSAFAKHVQDFAAAAGHAIVIGNTNLDPARESTQVEMVLNREVDGLIAFGIRDDATRLRLTNSGIRLVSMDWQFQDASVPTIVADDYGAAREAAEHLVAHGYKSVAYIGGPAGLEVSSARRQAWLDATKDVNTATSAGLEVSSEHSRRGGYEAALRILDVTDRPRSIFVSSDIQAIGALRACHQLGLRVPTDVAIVSFDGTEDSAYSTPPLTAVHLPLRLMAEHAVRKVLGNSAGMDLHSTVPHRLIIRQSCGCTPITSPIEEAAAS